MEEFYAITTNALGGEPEISKIKAKDETEAWEIIDEGSHNFDRSNLLTKKEYDILRKKIINNEYEEV